MLETEAREATLASEAWLWAAASEAAPWTLATLIAEA
jgi:hypothetical protein